MTRATQFAIRAMLCLAFTTSAPDPEHARLATMVGSWDIEMTLWPRPGTKGITIQGTSSIRALFDGAYVEEKLEGAVGGTTFSTMTWTGFNTQTKEYEATRISSTTTWRIAESGTWNEPAHQFELKGTYQQSGETWTQRTVIQQATGDAMTATSYLSFGKVPEWKAVEIKYTRKPK